MKEKLKIAFDIDVALVHVWKEKKDARREEVEEFFRLISEKKEKLSIVIGTHVLNRIRSWKNKKIVERLEKLYSNYEVKNPEELILEFSSKLKKEFKEIVKDFSRKAEIKEEDAATLIAYSLLGIEYFVTLNKKHLRNKYAKIKTIGWEFGLKIPEIMLPNEFSLFLQRYASNQISASGPSKLPSNFNKVSFFSHKFKLDFIQFKSFLSKLFKKNHSNNRSHLPSFNPALLSGLNALKIFVLSILTLWIILPLSEARSFIVYNVSNPLQTYFIVNGTTGYVGIGLINPAYPLHVVGNAYFANDIICSGCIHSSDIANGAVGLNQLASISCPEGSAIRVLGNGQLVCIPINATQGVINGSGIVNYIPVFTGVSTISASPFYLTSNNLNLGQQSLINASWINASYLNISAGLVVLPSGNIGIGTISPAYKLDVNGDIRGQSNL
ncbi:MAG: hypothetical protein NDF52_01620, partial [archaeon YNP-WB-062]|nr:hypothetical protein [Candidatus Culexarchaeum yellowstonense]